MNSKETNKSSSLRRKKIKLKWLFSLPRNSKKCNEEENEEEKKKPEKLCKSASSLDIRTNIKEKQPKQTMFSTLKRNFQSKFSPNRKIIDENLFVPINNDNNELTTTTTITTTPRSFQQNQRIYENVPLPDRNIILLNNNNTTPTTTSSIIQIESNNYDSIINNTSVTSDNLDNQSAEHSEIENARIGLTKYGWYWGALSRSAAQRTLAQKPNGSFLVRNSETDKLQFTLSFRSAGVTLHNRINYVEGYWHIESLHYKSIIELFEDTIKKSEENIFCYVKPLNYLLPPIAVRLTNPINRFYEVSSLQHLCRFVIRTKLDIEHFSKLPLPSKVKAYVEENFYENI